LAIRLDSIHAAIQSYTQRINDLEAKRAAAMHELRNLEERIGGYSKIAIDYTTPIQPPPDDYVTWPGKEDGKPLPGIIWLDSDKKY
jgi:tetrahydromethanopterin S-methyltransferase subunit B